MHLLFNFTTLLKRLLSHNIELLVNTKMHLSIKEINFVYLLLILDCAFFFLLYKNRKFRRNGRRNDCVTKHSLSDFSTKTYVVGTQKNRLIEMVLLNTQNIR